jgi:uncharacterized membrane protein
MHVYVPQIAILAAAAALAAVLAAAAARWGGRLRLRAPNPAAVVGALAAVYFAVFVAASLGRHFGMNTYGADLGIYANVIYHHGHGQFFRQTIIPAYNYYDNHCEPILILFGPLARVFRDPAYLLVLQTLFIAAGVVLIYAVGRPERGSRWPAAALAASFALSPALHGANLYDFHSRSLAVPFVLGAFYFYSRRRFVPGLICNVLLALTMDALALHAVALAVYGAFASGRRRPGLGVAALIFVYFVGFCYYLYPRLTYATEGSYGAFADIFLGFFARMRSPYGAVIANAKGGYLLALLAPAAAFLPWAGLALATLATPLAMPAFAAVPQIFQLGWQYPLSSLPFIYGAAALAARRLVKAEMSPRRRFYLTAASVAAVAFQLVFIAMLARDYYGPYLRTAFPTSYESSLYAASTRVPADAAVVADEVFTAHLAHRRYIQTFESAVEVEELPAPPEAMLLERRRHPLTELPFIFFLADRWNLSLRDCTGEYAYFARGPAKKPRRALMQAWYRAVEEWQCPAPRGKRVADPRAHDGRALYAPSFLTYDPLPGDVLPAGRYTLAFVVRVADGRSFCPTSFIAHVVDAGDPGRVEDFRPRLSGN